MSEVVNWPMIDMTKTITARELFFYMDASKILGFGGIYQKCWIFGKWDPDFIRVQDPSIAYLELFALTAGIVTWDHLLTDCRIIIYCDNQSVVEMVNQLSSKCAHCMKLIRILVLDGMRHN